MCLAVNDQFWIHPVYRDRESRKYIYKTSTHDIDLLWNVDVVKRSIKIIDVPFHINSFWDVWCFKHLKSSTKLNPRLPLLDHRRLFHFGFQKCECVFSYFFDVAMRQSTMYIGTQSIVRPDSLASDMTQQTIRSRRVLFIFGIQSFFKLFNVPLVVSFFFV